MQRTLTQCAGIAILFLLLTGCGNFIFEGQVLPETTPTPTPQAGADSTTVQAGPFSEEVAPVAPFSSTPSAPQFRFGLVEIIIILSLVVTASTVVGAYFLIKERVPTSDYPQLDDSTQEKRSLVRLLHFKPDVGSLILALCTWAVMLGVLTIFVIGILLVAGNVFTKKWEPALTYPSSILIGTLPQHISLPPDRLDCTLHTSSDDSEQLRCDTQFEDALLEVEVILENQMNWYCSALYASESIPCRASFDHQDYDTYIVIESNLGLSTDRYEQLINNPIDKRWGENEWLWLAKAVVAGFSLAVTFLLWRHSGKSATETTESRIVFGSIYAGSIGLMLFFVANYLSLLVLLVLKVVN